MFEIGKTYVFYTFGSDGEQGSSSFEVIEIEGTLLKISNGFQAPEIINVASPAFIRAVPQASEAEEGVVRGFVELPGWDKD